MFEPGTKVVCINDTFPHSIHIIYRKLPSKNLTYTVRDIVPGRDLNNLKETTAVLLEEIHNPPNEAGIEHGFHISRFQELESTTHSVSDHISQSLNT